MTLPPELDQSAYDELKAKYEDLLSSIPKVPTHPYEKALLDQIEELKAQADKLVEALEIYEGSWECSTYDDYHRRFVNLSGRDSFKALAQYRKWKASK